MYKNKNFAKSTIASELTSDGTSVVVATGEGVLFPQTGTFLGVIWSVLYDTPLLDVDREIITLTYLNTDTFTITRHEEGTSAKSWSIDSNIAHVLTAGKIDEIENAIQSNSMNKVVIIGTNTYTGSLDPIITSYSDGMLIVAKFTNSSSSACTLDIDVVGEKKIFLNVNNTYIQANVGDIIAGLYYILSYNSTLDSGNGGWVLFDKKLSVTEVFANVMNYGVIGDGTTDDTAAIQSAINACESAGGGTVVFPANNYKITNSLILKNHVNLLGVGAGILTGGTFTGTIIKPVHTETHYPAFINSTTERIHNFSVRNFVIDFTADNGGTPNADDIGFKFSGAYYPDNFEIENIIVKYAYYAYYDNSGAWMFKVSRFWSRLCKNGFYKYGGTTPSFENCFAEGSTVLDKSAKAWHLESILGASLTACAFDNWYCQYPFYANDCSGLSINGIDAEANQTDVDSGSIYYFYSCQGLSVKAITTYNSIVHTTSGNPGYLVNLINCNGDINLSIGGYRGDSCEGNGTSVYSVYTTCSVAVPMYLNITGKVDTVTGGSNLTVDRFAFSSDSYVGSVIFTGALFISNASGGQTYRDSYKTMQIPNVCIPEDATFAKVTASTSNPVGTYITSQNILDGQFGGFLIKSGDGSTVLNRSYWAANDEATIFDYTGTLNFRVIGGSSTTMTLDENGNLTTSGLINGGGGIGDDITIPGTLTAKKVKATSGDNETYISSENSVASLKGAFLIKTGEINRSYWAANSTATNFDYTGNLTFNSGVNGTPRMTLTAAGLVNIPGLSVSLPVVTDASRNLASITTASLATLLGVGTGSTPTFAGINSTANIVLNNNINYQVKDSSGIARSVVSMNSSNEVTVGAGSCTKVILGYGATESNAIYIKVNGVSNKQISVGATDSGGSGYRLLRVTN